MGWRIEGEFPNIPKLVMIVAPHSSNWDFPVGLAAKFALGLHARWLGKHTLFWGPAGPLFRALGGIPVNRSKPHNVVDDTVREFARNEGITLAITPEGTRKRVAEWKTGFWHISSKADAPMLPIILDWGEKVLRIGEPIYARGTVKEQLASIKAPFAGARARR
jgi:1-acyl-sn-glycerol-3-phosphate acyltransferase